MKSLIDYKFAKVLVVAAHFDDESLFAGGTLKILADQKCDIAVAVTAGVEVTNAPRPRSDSEPLLEVEIQSESGRQHRRLIAFGRVCGMIGVSRVELLDGHNCRADYDTESEEMRSLIREEIGTRIVPVIDAFGPDVVITHGEAGEYGHGQHRLVHEVVTKVWDGPLWHFAAEGSLRVPIDIEFKKKLLDCYRRGTTQDAYWTPYKEVPGESALTPWIGDVEGFDAR